VIWLKLSVYVSRGGLSEHLAGSFEQIDISGSWLFIRCESEKDFNDDTAQSRFGTHAFGTCALGFGLTLVQILQNMLADGRGGINDTADHFQLLDLGMIENVGHRRHLFFSELQLKPWMDTIRNPYNETLDLVGQAEAYLARSGFYPESIHA
jgi:hypothetical protein